MFFLLFVGDAEEVFEKEEFHNFLVFGTLLVVPVDKLHNRLERFPVILEFVVEIHNKSKELLRLSNRQIPFLLLIITPIERLDQIYPPLVLLLHFGGDMRLVIVKNNGQQYV